MTSFNVVLFDDFETLDAFGPVEVIGNLPEDYELKFFSFNGGTVISKHHVRVETLPFSSADASGALLIPGGMGTRRLAGDDEYLEGLRSLAERASYVLTVCTGSGLLAKTGLLDGKRATSNKMSFEWASSNSALADWVKKARWVRDGKFYTSSGISAGIDMALGFVSDIHGIEKAKYIARYMEYLWNMDMDSDPFAI